MVFYEEPEFIRYMIDIIRVANGILRSERSPGMKIDIKTDCNGRKSQVSSGDIKCNEHIMRELKKINRQLKESNTGCYNIISEEAAEEPYELRCSSDIDGTWLVDPLDGTADYCNFDIDKPCYTCNIGLVIDGDPVFGIFSVPETGVIYYGIKDIGSFKIPNENNIAVSDDNLLFPGVTLILEGDKDFTRSGVRVATSASHINRETEKFISKHFTDVVCFSFASSLKIGAVADGQVDIYPRCGLTYEWDTCAADAVVRFAGGGVYVYDPEKELSGYTEMLKYNKRDLLNPYFIVF